jgi:hypothetical protein
MSDCRKDRRMVCVVRKKVQYTCVARWWCGGPNKVGIRHEFPPIVEVPEHFLRQVSSGGPLLMAHARRKGAGSRGYPNRQHWPVAFSGTLNGTIKHRSWAIRSPTAWPRRRKVHRDWFVGGGGKAWQSTHEYEWCASIAQFQEACMHGLELIISTKYI